MSARVNNPGHHDHRTENGGECYADALQSLCLGKKCKDFTDCKCGGDREGAVCHAPDIMRDPAARTDVVACATCALCFHPQCHSPPITGAQRTDVWQCGICHAAYHMLLRRHTAAQHPREGQAQEAHPAGADAAQQRRQHGGKGRRGGAGRAGGGKRKR